MKENTITTRAADTSWMHYSLPEIGHKTMREICMPGSHDAGMSVYDSGTALATPCNTQTQTGNVFAQLRMASRYFDIRPVIHGGKFYTGHYSHIDALSSWQGANGQSIADIINDVNNFTKDNPELIILNLSHDLNTDLGNNSYAPFTQEEWNRLFTQLQGIQNLKTVSAGDLSLLKLNDFIGDNKAAVIVVVQPSGSCDLGGFSGKGFYTYNQYNVYNSYAETSYVDKMTSDQLGKLKKQRQSKDDPLFLLSWTMTQTPFQAGACHLGQPSIINMAGWVNPKLADIGVEIGGISPIKLANSPSLFVLNVNCFPNIILIDDVNNCFTMMKLVRNINSLN